MKIEELYNQLLKDYDEQLKINEEHQKLNGELREENKQLKEQVDRLIKKEYEKDNNYIVKVRTGEQLEREQYLLNFKSKSMLASMLIDAEERIDKVIKMFEADEHFEDGCYCDEIYMYLKGDSNE